MICKRRICRISLCSCHPDAHYTNQTCKHCNRVSRLHVEEVRGNGAFGLLWHCPKCDKVNR